jgi:hypothetical protein
VLRHLVRPTQEMKHELIDVIFNSPIRRQPGAIVKVARPAPQQSVQPIPHHQPSTDMRGFRMALTICFSRESLFRDGLAPRYERPS